MLEVKDLNAFYGKSHILHGVQLTVNAGEIVSLLGRNGVGRSTTIKAIMGMVDCRGSVRFRGEEMVGLKTFQIAHKGLGYVPENRDIFPTLTVRQNLLLGQKANRPTGRWKAEDMFELFPRLRERADTQAGVLSGGEQQMLTLCRTLMGDPALVMIDEPTEGRTLIMVEHDMGVVFDLADRISVLVYGEIIATGKPEEIRANPAVQEAYLGALHKEEAGDA